MMRKSLLKLAAGSGVVLVCGCSSVMTHTGGAEGTYPGTHASTAMLARNDTNIGLKSLIVLDMPLTAVVDTLLLPWDMNRTDSTIKTRVLKSEQDALATNAVIPPARAPAH